MRVLTRVEKIVAKGSSAWALYIDRIRKPTLPRKTALLVSIVGEPRIKPLVRAKFSLPDHNFSALKERRTADLKKGIHCYGAS